MLDMEELRKYFPHAEKREGRYDQEDGTLSKPVTFYRLVEDGGWYTERTIERVLMFKRVQARRIQLRGTPIQQEKEVKQML